MARVSVGYECEIDDGVKSYVIDALGVDFWWRLVAAFHGMEIKVPVQCSTLSDDHWLVRALGLDDAKALVSAFRGEKIYVHQTTNVRWELYRAAALSGLNNSQIARKYAVSVRTVRRGLQRLGVRNPNSSRGFVPRLTERERELRNGLVSAYRDGHLTSSEAAETIGITENAFRCYLRKPQPDGSTSPTVSNAPLTRLAHVSTPFTHPTPETRVSGP